MGAELGVTDRGSANERTRPTGGSLRATLLSPLALEGSALPLFGSPAALPQALHRVPSPAQECGHASSRRIRSPRGQTPFSDHTRTARCPPPGSVGLQAATQFPWHDRVDTGPPRALFSFYQLAFKVSWELDFPRMEIQSQIRTGRSLDGPSARLERLGTLSTRTTWLPPPAARSAC